MFPADACRDCEGLPADLPRRACQNFHSEISENIAVGAVRFRVTGQIEFTRMPRGPKSRTTVRIIHFNLRQLQNDVFWRRSVSHQVWSLKKNPIILTQLMDHFSKGIPLGAESGRGKETLMKTKRSGSRRAK